MAEAFVFGGAPSEPVPPVDPADLERIWSFSQTAETKATGIALLQHLCSPGANVQAVGYRSMMLWLLQSTAPDVLARWWHGDRFDATVFAVMARIKVEWMEVGIIRNDLPFNVDEFVAQIQSEMKT